MKCEWTSRIKRLSIIDSDDSNCYMMLMLFMNLHLVLLNLKCYEWFLHNFSFLDPFDLLWITLQHTNKSIFIATMAIATHLFCNRHTMKKRLEKIARIFHLCFWLQVLTNLAKWTLGWFSICLIWHFFFFFFHWWMLSD